MVTVQVELSNELLQAARIQAHERVEATGARVVRQPGFIPAWVASEAPLPATHPVARFPSQGHCISMR